MNSDLDRELAYRREIGCEILSVSAMTARYRALGYRLNRRDDCRHYARYMDGPRAGESYPCVSTGLVEADTGLSVWNIHARRDDNFRAMQELRGSVCAVSRGYVLEV